MSDFFKANRKSSSENSSNLTEQQIEEIAKERTEKVKEEMEQFLKELAKKRKQRK